MSAEAMQMLFKADYSFYRGFVDYRFSYRRALAIHIIEIAIFAVFIPIDLTLLHTGDRMVAALAVAAADSVASLLLTIYAYSLLFAKQPILSYCQLAAQTNHATNEPVSRMQSIEDCTSTDVLHFTSGVPVAGIAQPVVNVYSNIAAGQIEQVCEFKWPQLGWCGKLYNFLALAAMLLVIILLSTSTRLNAGEITILIIFLLLEAFVKLKIIIVMAIIALSPLICIFLICYVCCCKQRDGQMKLDLRPKMAQTDDIVRSGGECAICLMNFNINDPIYQLKCSDKHIFHAGCLENWASVKATCPTCRANLPLTEVADANQAQGV